VNFIVDIKKSLITHFPRVFHYTIDDFWSGEYKDRSTHGTWYSSRHPRWISCPMGWSILVFTEIESR